MQTTWTGLADARDHEIPRASSFLRSSLEQDVMRSKIGVARRRLGSFLEFEESTRVRVGEHAF